MISQIAALLKSRGLPAEAWTNGVYETIVIETLDSERLVLAPGDGGWGYTLVGEDGLVEVGWIEELNEKSSPEEVAEFIINEIDFIFDTNQ